MPLCPCNTLMSPLPPHRAGGERHQDLAGGTRNLHRHLRIRRRLLQAWHPLQWQGNGGVPQPTGLPCILLPLSPVLPPLPHGCSPTWGMSPALPLQMLLKGANGTALPQKQLLLIVRQQGGDVRKTLLTDSSGKASFELDTSDWTGTVSLEVSDSSPTP